MRRGGRPWPASSAPRKTLLKAWNCHLGSWSGTDPKSGPGSDFAATLADAGQLDTWLCEHVATVGADPKALRVWLAARCRERAIEPPSEDRLIGTAFALMKSGFLPVFWCAWRPGNRREDHEVSMLALHLLQNCLIYMNTLMLQRVLAQPHWAGRLSPRDLSALTPLFWDHINPYGRSLVSG